MDLAQLEEQIAAQIQRMNDKQIILMEAGDLGLAVFPDADIVVAHATFIDTAWQRTKGQWEQKFGRGHLIYLNGSGEEPLFDMAYTRVDEESSSELQRKLVDTAWVTRYAAKARESMLTEVTSAAKLAMDFVQMTGEP